MFFCYIFSFFRCWKNLATLFLRLLPYKGYSSAFWLAAGFDIRSNGYGYETENRTGSTAAIMTEIAKDEIDVHMEIWSGNLGESYVEGV